MRLLLLLSALLSALSGVVSGGAVAQQSAAVARAAEEGARLPVLARRGLRPLARRSGPIDVAVLSAPASLALPATVPAFASRRRE